MKKLSYLAFFLFLSILAGCEDAPLEEGMERGWNPLRCTSKSSGDCGIDWYVSLKGDAIPQNLQVLLNEQVIIDECDPQPYWEASTTSQVVEFKIKDYANLSGEQTLDMRVFDMKDCSARKKEIGFWANQKYTVKNVGGEKRIIIERDL